MHVPIVPIYNKRLKINHSLASQSNHFPNPFENTWKEWKSSPQKAEQLIPTQIFTIKQCNNFHTPAQPSLFYSRRRILFRAFAREKGFPSASIDKTIRLFVLYHILIRPLFWVSSELVFWGYCQLLLLQTFFFYLFLLIFCILNNKSSIEKKYIK